MIRELNELIEAYDEGVYALDDVLNRILSLSSAHAVNDIVNELPDNWRHDFLSWARENFDNGIPLDQFVIITQGTPSDEALRPITLIREWFHKQSAS